MKNKKKNKKKGILKVSSSSGFGKKKGGGGGGGGGGLERKKMDYGLNLWQEDWKTKPCSFLLKFGVVTPSIHFLLEKNLV